MMRRNILLLSVLLVLVLVAVGVVVLGAQFSAATADTVAETDADAPLMSVADPAKVSSIEAFTKELEEINAYTQEEFDWSTVNFENISYG